MVLAIGIEHSFYVAVQRPHYADAHEHRRPTKLGNKQQTFHRGLPFGGVVLRFRKFRDEGAGVLQGDELAPARKQYRIVERSFPTARTFAANISHVDLPNRVN